MFWRIELPCADYGFEVFCKSTTGIFHGPFGQAKSFSDLTVSDGLACFAAIQQEQPHLQQWHPSYAFTLVWHVGIILRHHDPFLLNADHTALLFSLLREGEGKCAPIDDFLQQAVLFQRIDGFFDFRVCSGIASCDTQEITHVGKSAAIGEFTVGKHRQQRQQFELIIGSCQPIVFKFSLFVLQELLQGDLTPLHR